MRESIAGGEGFDWYYPTFEARRSRERSAISDGTAGKPWVFRYKDLRNWWSQPHYNRIGGEELEEPTAWVPESKPFFFTEIGCGAVDKATNQPNVFPDPKSTEGRLPYFSGGGRSDLAQARFRYRGLGEDGQLGEWTDRWEQVDALPLQVSLELSSRSGGVWPPLVVSLPQQMGGMVP